MGQSRNKLSQLNKPPIKMFKTKENFDSNGKSKYGKQAIIWTNTIKIF